MSPALVNSRLQCQCNGCYLACLKPCILAISNDFQGPAQGLLVQLKSIEQGGNTDVPLFEQWLHIIA